MACKTSSELQRPCLPRSRRPAVSDQKPLAPNTRIANNIFAMRVFCRNPDEFATILNAGSPTGFARRISLIQLKPRKRTSIAKFSTGKGRKAEGSPACNSACTRLAGTALLRRRSAQLGHFRYRETDWTAPADGVAAMSHFDRGRLSSPNISRK